MPLHPPTPRKQRNTFPAWADRDLTTRDPAAELLLVCAAAVRNLLQRWSVSRKEFVLSTRPGLDMELIAELACREGWRSEGWSASKPMRVDRAAGQAAAPLPPDRLDALAAAG